MKKEKITTVVCWILKALGAAMVAFVILNAASYFYYYVPYNVPCETKETDFKLPAGFQGYTMREGFGKTQIDENGYNNRSIPEEIDVLCMGSSQTLGYNVFPDKNYVALFNDKLQENKNMSAYNIGMYGHEWYYCMKNLDAALKKYHPKKYVVIENFYSKFDLDKLQRLNEGQYGQAGEVVSPLMAKVKKFPYMQVALSQLKTMMSQNISTNEVEYGKEKEEKTEDMEEYTKQLSEALVSAKESADQYGVKIVFLYHPSIKVDQKGEAYADIDEVYYRIWQTLCEENEIEVVDVTDSFLEAYEKDYILPEGFANTTIGSGHMNRYGHQMLADALYERIVADEEEED